MVCAISLKIADIGFLSISVIVSSLPNVCITLRGFCWKIQLVNATIRL